MKKFKKWPFSQCLLQKLTRSHTVCTSALERFCFSFWYTINTGTRIASREVSVGYFRYTSKARSQATYFHGGQVSNENGLHINLKSQCFVLMNLAVMQCHSTLGVKQLIIDPLLIMPLERFFYSASYCRICSGATNTGAIIKSQIWASGKTPVFWHLILTSTMPLISY